MKNNKYWKRRLSSQASTIEAYHHHLDLRSIDDLDDEGLAYLLKDVKSVNMLDLNETEISNESIQLLTQLEYLKELRVKGCRIDNGCMADLNKITGLEFLHLKNTGVTIEGLLQLKNLINLKELMFSVDNMESIMEKMLQLKQQLPGCAFTVNSKPWNFEEE